jgi:SAM-dependent methyltransferase
MLSKGLFSLATREALSQPKLERTPQIPGGVELGEEELRINEDAAARAFQGIFHFNALAASKLVPQNGLVLDLGSGSGGFATYFAEHRPDITIIGVDPSPRQVELGQRLLAEGGLTDRININLGEITDFSQRIPSQVDMITSVMSLHTVASTEELFRCFQEISLVRIRCGCAVWMFDFCRPNAIKTAEEFPVALMPGTPIPFRRNCRNSLMASFTFKEMSEALSKVSLGTVNHAQSKGFKIFQAHWLDREDELKSKDDLWHEGRISAAGLQQFKDVSGMFPTVPLPKHLK